MQLSRSPRRRYQFFPPGRNLPTAVPSFQVLGRGPAAALDAFPEAGRRDGGHEVEDAEADAEAPDGLDLKAGCLVRVNPLKVVLPREIEEKGVYKVGCVALVGERRAREVADGLADDTSHHDGGDETKAIGTGGNQQREHRVPVENVRDYGVNSSDASLVFSQSAKPLLHSPRRSVQRQECRPAQAAARSWQSPFRK